MRFKLTDLAKNANPHLRGYEFEELLLKLFASAGFQVIKNPKATKPRQTDLLAVHGDQYYVVEAKWTARAIDSSELVLLADRIGKVSAGCIGCLFSMAGFTKEAISMVKNYKVGQILLFDKQDVEKLEQNPSSFLGLIERKRRALMIDGDVFFSSKDEYYLSNRVQLPESHEWFVDSKGKKCTIVSSEAVHFNDIVFMRSWAFSAFDDMCNGAQELELYLGEITHKELGSILRLLHLFFHVSGNGSFVFAHNEAICHGIGVLDFLSSVGAPDRRYNETYPRHKHHSERIKYIDSFQNGFVVVEGDNDLVHLGDIDHVQIKLCFSGVPVDVSSVQKFCCMVNHPEVCFKPLQLETNNIRFKKRIIVSPVSRVFFQWPQLGTDISGLIINNPFYKNTKRLPKEKLSKHVLQQVASLKHISFHLRDRLFLRDVIDNYFMESIEITTIDGSFCIMATGTWGKLLSQKSLGKKIKTEA